MYDSPIMSNRSKAILLILIDLVILCLSLTVVVGLRLGPSALPKHYDLFSYLFPLWILLYFIEGMYTLKTFNPEGTAVSLLRGTFLAVIVAMLGTYVAPDRLTVLTPKTNLVLTAVVALPFLYFWRRFFFRFFSREKRLVSTVLIGNQQTVDLIKHEIQRRPHLGFKIDEHISGDTQLIAIERNLKDNANLYQDVFAKLEAGVEVMDLARFAENVSGKIPLAAIDESWFIEHCGHQESRSFDLIKTALDKTVAITLFTMLLPVTAVLLPFLLIVHGRPIFFKQIRTGRHNKPFKLYKLRSMVVDAEKDGAQWAKPKDARVTTVGKFLRKSRLDELPQLLNIVRGEMSLVGPRPERPEIIEKTLAREIPYYNLRHLVKPGVTGWAQVTFRYGFSTQDSLEKLQYDLYYVKNRNLWLDILIVLKTVKTVLTGAGQ